MPKARRGRRRQRRPSDPEAGGQREHWRADGAPKVAYGSADEANRAASLRRAVAAGTAIALVPLAGVSLSAAMILSFACSEPNSLGWTAPAALALAVVGLLAGIGAVVGLAMLIRITEDDLATPPAGTGSVPQWS